MSEDTIYRQDAIDAAIFSATEWDETFVQDLNVRLTEAINKLPSAETSIVTVTIGIDEKRLNEIVEEAERRLAAEQYNSAEPDVEEWIGGELGHTSKCGHEGCSSDIWDGCKNFYCPNCGRKVIWR